MPRIDQIDRRTDVVLLLFHHAESIRGVAKLQQLVFLVEQEATMFDEYGDAFTFEFYPHETGPLSDYVFEEIRLLQELRAIETVPANAQSSITAAETPVGDVFRLTSKGEKIAAELARQLEHAYGEDLSTLVDEYNGMSLSALFQYVCSAYPRFMRKAELEDDVLVKET